MTMSMGDPKVRKDFVEAGKAQLDYLEWFGANCGAEVVGVPVIQAITYDAVQMLNHHFLVAYLAEQPEEQVLEKEQVPA